MAFWLITYLGYGIFNGYPIYAMVILVDILFGTGMGDTIGIVDRYFGLRYQVSVSVSMNLKLRYEYRYRYRRILNSDTSIGIGIDEIQLTILLSVLVSLKK